MRAPNGLLALEHFSVGGFETVRGYFENQLRPGSGRWWRRAPRGALAVRYLQTNPAPALCQWRPFFDFGGGWNKYDSPDPTTIISGRCRPAGISQQTFCPAQILIGDTGCGRLMRGPEHPGWLEARGFSFRSMWKRF
jgi:hypothetical protein